MSEHVRGAARWSLLAALAAGCGAPGGDDEDTARSRPTEAAERSRSPTSPRPATSR